MLVNHKVTDSNLQTDGGVLDGRRRPRFHSLSNKALNLHLLQQSWLVADMFHHEELTGVHVLGWGGDDSQ